MRCDELYTTIRRELDERKGSRDTLQNILAESDAKQKTLAARHRLLSDGIIAVQKFSESLQTGVVQRFEDLLTQGVRHIFGKDYRITIEFSISGNTMHADFFVILPDGKKVNMAKGEGGGLRDVVSILQRILYLELEPSQPAKVLFLDEDLSFLDTDRVPGAFSFLCGVASDLGIQIIWITHQREIVDGDSETKGMKTVELS